MIDELISRKGVHAMRLTTEAMFDGVAHVSWGTAFWLRLYKWNLKRKLNRIVTGRQARAK